MVVSVVSGSGLIVTAAAGFLQGVQILILLVDHPALQRDGQFPNAGDGNHIRLLQMQAQLRHLVHISAGPAAADTQNLLHIRVFDRHIDGKLTIFVQKCLGMTALAHKHRKDRLFPLYAQGSPADGHGVHLSVCLGGHQHTFPNLFQNLSCILP